jgi:hypothetical protein
MFNIPAPTSAPANGFFSLEKLKGKNILLIAARHNKRTNQGEITKSTKIDPNLSHLNQSIMGEATPEGVVTLAKSLMETAGIKKLRKDAVLGIECLFSLPADHRVDEIIYFQECAKWIQSHFNCHILAADIHRDESCPHCHILLLPLVNGKMIGSKLMGYKKNLSSLQEAFYQNVASKFGFERPPKPLNNEQRKRTAIGVLDYLVQTQDPVTKSSLWPAIVESIYKSPIGFAKAIGLEIAMICTKRMKTMAQIFTSKGKGKQNQDSNFLQKKYQNICSVDFDSGETSSLQKISNEHVDESIRLVNRENDISVNDFNTQTGEFSTSNDPKQKWKS